RPQLPIIISRHLFFLNHRRPPGSPLFPYTTLFRSGRLARDRGHLHPARESGRWGLEPQLRVRHPLRPVCALPPRRDPARGGKERDRKSTRLNSSHVAISYAVFCLKKKSKIAGPSIS